MQGDKLSHSIIGAIVSWGLTAVAWTEDHIGLLAGIAAIIASFFTIRAAKATAALRRAQRRQVEMEIAKQQQHESKVEDE